MTLPPWSGVDRTLTNPTTPTARDSMDGVPYPERLAHWRRGGRGSFSSTGNRLVIFGDSIAGQHGYTLPITSIILDGSTTAVVNWTAHNCIVGSRVYGFRATDEALNGHFEVASVTSANQFTITLPAAASGTVTDKGGGGLYATKQNVLTDIGSLNWLTCLNDACFDIVGVCAEGASLSSYLSTLVANANDDGLDYDWAAIITGINDAAAWLSTPAEGSAEALVANITAASDALRAAGKGVIISTIGPWSSGHPSYTAGRYAEVQAANALLRTYVGETVGVFLMDAYEAGSTAGVPDSNILSDGLHPSQLGAYTYAKQFMTDNPGVLPSPTVLPTASADDDYYVNSANRQFWKNPMFSGSGGVATTVANTGSTTGTIPADQWLGAFGSDAGGVAALASSLVTASTGNGNAIQADWTGEDNNDGVYLRLTDLYPEALVAGEYVRLICRLRVETTGGGAPTQMGRNMLWMQANIGAGTRTIMGMLYNASMPAAAAYPQFTEQLTLVTPRHRFPTLTGLTQLQPFVQMNTKATCFNSYFIENPAMRATAE